MRYRCHHCGRETGGDGDKTTDNLVSQSVCAACAGMPRAGWAANTGRRRRHEREAARDAGEAGAFAPGTEFDMDAWRAPRSAGASDAEAARAAAGAGRGGAQIARSNDLGNGPPFPPGPRGVGRDEPARTAGSGRIEGLSCTPTEKDSAMHASSELRQWFLGWLDDASRNFDHGVTARLNELRSCADELPAGYCQRGILHVPFGVTYGDAVQKILGETD